MPQYFDNVDLPHEDLRVQFELRGKRYCLYSDRGVFSNRSLDYGTRLLIETLLDLGVKGKVLDLGAGLGPIGLILASSDPSLHVVCSDVNERALGLCKKNLESLGLSSRVETVNSDVYSNIETTDFDLIACNPPIRAGKKVTYAMYEGAPSHLKEGGRLIIVIRKQQGAESALAYLRTLFPKVEVIASKKGYKVISSTK